MRKFVTASFLGGLAALVALLALSARPAAGDNSADLPSALLGNAYVGPCTEGDWSGRPARPAGIAASSKDGAVVLTWTNCSGILDRFEIKRGTSPDINAGAKTIAGQVSKDLATFTDKDVELSRTYHYWVIAYAGNINSYLPDPVAITLAIPPTPTPIPTPSPADILSALQRIQEAAAELWVAKSLGDEVMAGRIPPDLSPVSGTPTPVPVPASFSFPGLDTGARKGASLANPGGVIPAAPAAMDKQEAMTLVRNRLFVADMMLKRLQDEASGGGFVDYLLAVITWGQAFQSIADAVVSGSMSEAEAVKLWQEAPIKPPPIEVVLVGLLFAEALEQSANRVEFLTKAGSQVAETKDTAQMRRVAAELEIQKHWLENQIASKSADQAPICPREQGCHSELIPIMPQLTESAWDLVAGKADAPGKWNRISTAASHAIAPPARPAGPGGAPQPVAPQYAQWFEEQMNYCKALGGTIWRYEGFAFACKWTSKATPIACDFFVDNVGEVTPSAATVPACDVSKPASYTGPVPGEPPWYRRAVADCKSRLGGLVFVGKFGFQCQWTNPKTADVGRCDYIVNDLGEVELLFRDPKCALNAPRSYAAGGAPAKEPTGPVKPLVDLSFSPPVPLPPATSGQEYSHWFCDPPPAGRDKCGAAAQGALRSPSGGVPPYTFNKGFMRGSLPSGLVLSANGRLYGVPKLASEAGKPFKFEICVTDKVGKVACAEAEIQVLAPVETKPKFDGRYEGQVTDRCVGGTVDGKSSRSGNISLVVQGSVLTSGVSVEGEQVDFRNTPFDASGNARVTVSLFEGTKTHTVVVSLSNPASGAASLNGSWTISYRGSVVRVDCSASFSLPLSGSGGSVTATPTTTAGATDEQTSKFDGYYEGKQAGTCRNVLGTRPYSDTFTATVSQNRLVILRQGAPRFGPIDIDASGKVRVVESQSYTITYDLTFSAGSASGPAAVQGTYEYVSSGAAAGCSATISARRA